MSDAAPAPTTAQQKKTPARTKKPAPHPPYRDMIIAAIVALKERGGSNRKAILKYIMANYSVGDAAAVNSHLKTGLKSGVENGCLKQSTKGTCVSGSVNIGEKTAAVKKPKQPKTKKPAKKVAKKPAAKTTKTPAKKPAAKKTAISTASKKPAVKKPASKK